MARVSFKRGTTVSTIYAFFGLHEVTSLQKTVNGYVYKGLVELGLLDSSNDEEAIPHRRKPQPLQCLARRAML